MTTRTKARMTARRGAAVALRGASAVIGRRRAVRATRFATNVLRFDEGGIESNGETLVQRVALSQPEPVVFDVGANLGQWSTALLAQPGHPPLLHLFEPSAYSHAKAAEAMGDRALVHALALSSEVGEADLQVVKDGDKTNSLVVMDYRNRTTTTERVRLETVDHFCDMHGIREITLLKVDAEGHDLSVLKGATEMLARGAIGIAQFEYNWHWVYSRTYLKDVFDLANELAEYSLGKITPQAIEFYDKWHPELEGFRESNFVLVRADWRARFPTVEWWGG